MEQIKLNHKCPICLKDIFLGDDVVIKQNITYHLNCFLQSVK